MWRRVNSEPKQLEYERFDRGFRGARTMANAIALLIVP